MKINKPPFECSVWKKKFFRKTIHQNIQLLHAADQSKCFVRKEKQHDFSETTRTREK